jgi:hypothetical protein
VAGVVDSPQKVAMRDAQSVQSSPPEQLHVSAPKT